MMMIFIIISIDRGYTLSFLIPFVLIFQWFGGLVSPRWWSAQWLLEALTSVLGQKAPPLGEGGAERQQDALLLDHVLPALR